MVRAATGEHAFDKLCAELGLEHCLTPPNSPQPNGLVERFTVRMEGVLQSHYFRPPAKTWRHCFIAMYGSPSLCLCTLVWIAHAERWRASAWACVRRPILVALATLSSMATHALIIVSNG